MPLTAFNADRHVTSWYVAWSARRSASVSASVPPRFTTSATSRVVGRLRWSSMANSRGNADISPFLRHYNQLQQCYCQDVMADTTLLDFVVRDAIYTGTIANSIPPTVDEVAEASGFDKTSVMDAFRRLAEMHVVVLKPGTTQLWSAPPFSAVPTSFRAKTSNGSWW